MPSCDELVVVRELQAAVLAAHHRAEDVADVAVAVAREDRALLAERAQPRQHRARRTRASARRGCRRPRCAFQLCASTAWMRS